MGSELELCCECDAPTGRAGRGEDSLYAGESGPYCESCWADARETLAAELTCLRARLEAAERKAREWQSAAIATGGAARSAGEERDAAVRELDIAMAEAECHSKNHDAALAQRDAALRELAEFKEVCAKRDADVLTALDYEGADSTPLHAAHVRLSELLGAKRQRDAANALLRRAHSSLSGSSSPTARKVYEAIDAHLAASPSPLASPEGDGAGRECERPMDLIERSRADLDLMDYEGARRAQEVIHIYVCPNERCSGGLIMDGRGGVLGRCKVCNPRRAQGGDSNAEGSGA